MKKTVIVIISIFIFFSVSADDITWTGGQNGSWHNPANWSTGSVPHAGDNAIIPAGTPTCVVTGNVSVGGINNSGHLQVLNENTETIQTNSITNSGVINTGSQTSSDNLQVSGLNGGINIQNTGTISGGSVVIINGSIFNNSGTVSGLYIEIKADNMTNTGSGELVAGNMSVDCGNVNNAGQITVNTFGNADGFSMTGNTLHNEGAISVVVINNSKDPAVDITFQTKIENYPDGKIELVAPNGQQKKIAISSPKLYNYGKITGYGTIAGAGKTDTIPSGTLILTGSDMVVDYHTRLRAKKIIMVYHSLYTYQVPSTHAVEALSDIELRGDPGAIYFIQSTCAENLFYSQTGNILILCDTLRVNSSTIEFLCDPDPITGPSDSTYIRGRIIPAMITDSAGGSGSFRVLLQNQGTCYKAFSYLVISPNGWITPLTGTTQVLKPFQFDSLEIQYSIPENPGIKSEPVSQILSVPPIFADTSYSYIRVSDSIVVGINDKFNIHKDFPLHVFPNPFSENCQIISGIDSEISIYDQLGRRILTTRSFKGRPLVWEPEANGNPQGYFVIAKAGNRYASCKLVFIK